MTVRTWREAIDRMSVLLESMSSERRSRVLTMAHEFTDVTIAHAKARHDAEPEVAGYDLSAAGAD